MVSEQLAWRLLLTENPKSLFFSPYFPVNQRSATSYRAFSVKMAIVPLQEAVYRRIVDPFYANILSMDHSFI